MADPVTVSDLEPLVTVLGTVRREIADDASLIRREVAEDASDIRREMATDTSDIRRETALSTSEMIKEGLKESFNVRGDVKDARYDLNSRIQDAAVNQVNATHQVSRDVVDNKIQITSLGWQVRDGFVASAKDAEINALKSQIELAKQTTYLSDKLDNGGEKTRDLISSLKEADLNRKLIERNSELVEERHESRENRHEADLNHSQGQWASVQSQLQAFASQLQETRQV